MEIFKRSWKRLPSTIRKPLIFVLGVAVIIAGVILLPLPGPGWVIIFLGFAILATEFEAAARIKLWTVNKLRQTVTELKKMGRKTSRKAKKPATKK